MSTAGKLCLVAAVAVAVVVGAWIARTPDDGVRAEAPGVLEHASGPGPAEGELRADLVREAERVALPAAGQEAESGATWVVRGRAVNDSGDPIPAMQIRLRLFEGVEATGEPLEERVVTSDGEGWFTWALDTPESPVVVQVRKVSKDHICYGDSRLWLPGRPPPADLEARFLPLDSVVTGVVRTAEGNPIPGALVRSAFDSDQCDASGKYRLRTTSANAEHYIYAQAAGYAQQRAIVRAGRAGTVTTADFDLPRSFRIRGRVLDEGGHPVQGARVSSETFGNEVESDAAGQFVLDHCDPREAAHWVVACLEGYVEASSPVDAARGEDIVQDLILKHGTRIQGHVWDAAGNPLAGAQVGIVRLPGDSHRQDAISREDGSFVLRSVEAGRRTLVTQCEDFAPDQVVLDIEEGQPLVNGVQIHLRTGHFIGGIVQNELGDPIEKVHVSVRHHDEYLRQRTRTDAEGRFRLGSLPESDVELEFSSESIFRHTEALTSMDHEELVVVPQEAGSIAGRVLDAQTGAPLDAFTVRFVNPRLEEGDRRAFGFSVTWQQEGYSFSGTNGYFDSGDEAMPPGSLIGIEIRAEEHAPARIDRVLVTPDPDPDALIVRLSRGATVSGVVLDENQRPIEAATVICRSAGDVDRWLSRDPHEEQVAQVGEHGNFIFERVEPGATVLFVQVPDRPVFLDGPFEVPAAGHVPERSIRLPKGGLIEGVVLAQDGKPAAGAQVRLSTRNARGPARHSAKTIADPQGAFLFDHLPDGEYWVSHVLAEGTRSVNSMTVVATIESGRAAVVRLQPQGSCSLRGSLTMNGSLPPVLSVSISPKPQGVPAGQALPPDRGAFARNGLFQVVGLEPGAYDVLIMHQEPGSSLYGAAVVTLRDGEDAQVEIRVVDRLVR